MATVKDFLVAMEQIAPVEYAQEWDNPGLNVGEENQPVRGVMVALDLTGPVIDEAVQRGANLIVTHHPSIFHPIKTVNNTDVVGRNILGLIKNGLSHIACHTNLDSAPQGVNDRLAELLGLCELEPFPKGGDGAGLGRMGTLPREMSPEEFALHIRDRLGVERVRLVEGTRPIKNVAVIGGSAAEYWTQAKKEGADAFLTGDVKYNQLLPASEEGFTLVDAGHFGTENPIVSILAEKLAAAFHEVPVFVTQNGRDCVKFI